MKILGFATVLMGFASLAQATIFESAVTSSDWLLIEHPTSCELNHYIEGYGKATFTQQADQSLSLLIETENYAAESADLSLRLISAPWKTTRLNEIIGDQLTQSGQLAFLFEDTPARLALTGLQNGDFVSMTYQSQSSLEPISIHLSSVNFYLALQNFQACLITLNSDSSFNLNAYRIPFASSKADLDKEAMNVLTRLANTLENDDRIRSVLIDAHTDSIGQKESNEALSAQRAEVVKNYLINQVGYDASKIETRSHTDARPIADNKNSEGRALNRRTEIRLIR